MKSKIHKYQNKYLTMSKNTIRTFVLTFTLIIFSSGHIVAQGMPVYDNTNFVSFTKSLIESAKQTSQLLKTVEFLKTQKNNIEKVNSAIKQLQAVRELAKNNKRLFDLIQVDLREILNSPFIKADEVNRISDSFNVIVENSLEGLEYIDIILSNDNLKMTDAERAEILKAKERESMEMVAEIEAKVKRYREIIAFREMQAVINERKAKY